MDDSELQVEGGGEGDEGGVGGGGGGVSRYHRQMLLEGFGEVGQKRISNSRVLVVGCGALGTVIVEGLVRAGVGHVRVVDRDVVEWTNLQRQVLFDEADAQAGAPKAVVAAQKLEAVNSSVGIEGVVADFNASNAPGLMEGVGLLIDGTDNFQTRYLLNDLAVREGLPYVYGGAVGTRGTVYPVLPHTPSAETAHELAGVAGPCLRCIEPDAPVGMPGGTCDTVGVLGPVAGIVGNLEVAESLKILTGQWEKVNRKLVGIDVYTNAFTSIDVSGAYEEGACVCCGQRRFDFLEGGGSGGAISLCGRNAIQIAARGGGGGGKGGAVELDLLAGRLKAHGAVTVNAYMVRAELRDGGKDFRITVFNDGRAVIFGTDEVGLAKSIYARYVGV